MEEYNETIAFEAWEWQIASDWGVTEEAWADILRLRRLTAFMEDLRGVNMR